MFILYTVVCWVVWQMLNAQNAHWSEWLLIHGLRRFLSFLLILFFIMKNWSQKRIKYYSKGNNNRIYRNDWVSLNISLVFLLLSDFWCFLTMIKCVKMSREFDGAIRIFIKQHFPDTRDHAEYLNIIFLAFRYVQRSAFHLIFLLCLVSFHSFLVLRSKTMRQFSRTGTKVTWARRTSKNNGTIFLFQK